MICISGGHYQDRPGAHHGDNYEFPMTFRWATSIVAHLNTIAAAPVSCIVPPGTLPKKIHFIRGQKAKMAVEVHFNSSPGGNQRGSETLYYPGSAKGMELAEAVQRVIGPLFLPNRGVKEGWYRMDRPGVVDYAGDVDGDETPDYFLRKTPCPSIIVEPEFVQNWPAIDANRQVACEIIAEALFDVAVDWRLV